MSDENAIKDLHRAELKHIWGSKPEEFLQSISETGGWPEGYTHVSFYHDGPGGNRHCVFTTHHLQTKWWTTVATSDDYYWFKISTESKASIEQKMRKKFADQIGRLA